MLKRVFGLTIIRNKLHDKFTVGLGDVVSANVLISVSVTTNNDWVSPSRDKLGDVLADNGLSEDSSVQDISDGSVRRFPHLLQFEFRDSFLIRSDSSALNTDLVFLDSVGSINSDLVIGLISVFDSQIEVLNVNVEIRKNVLHES